MLNLRRVAASSAMAAAGALVLRGAMSTPAFGAAVILAALLGLVWLSACLVFAGYVGVGTQRSPFHMMVVVVLAASSAFLIVQSGEMRAWLGWNPTRDDWLFVTSPTLGAFAAWIVHAPPSRWVPPRALVRASELPAASQCLIGLSFGVGLYLAGEWLAASTDWASGGASTLVPFAYPATLLVGVVVAALRLLTPKMSMIAAWALLAALGANVVAFTVDNQPMGTAEHPQSVLSLAVPKTIKMYGGVRPLSELGADELNRSHVDARAAGIRFVDADEPSTDLATVSVHPIDAYTWGAAVYSPSDQECHLVLVVQDPDMPGGSYITFDSRPGLSRCVGLLADSRTMGS